MKDVERRFWPYGVARLMAGLIALAIIPGCWEEVRFRRGIEAAQGGSLGLAAAVLLIWFAWQGGRPLGRRRMAGAFIGAAGIAVPVAVARGFMSDADGPAAIATMLDYAAIGWSVGFLLLVPLVPRWIGAEAPINAGTVEKNAK